MPTRLIREGLLDSERVCSLPLEARWLFVTVCLMADDIGIFDAAPFALMRKAELQRDLGPNLLSTLADADLIRLYEAGAKRYGFIPRYGQRLRLRQLRHPLPPAALYADDPEAVRKINDLASRLPAHCRNVRPEAEAEADKRQEKLSEITLSPSVAPSAAQKAPKAAKKPVEKKRPPSRRSPTVEEWPIPRDLKAWGRENCPLVDLVAETAQFRDHEFQKARSDWPATWRGWMRREQKRLAEGQKRQGGGKSFRERDAAQAVAEVKAWGTGRVAAKGDPNTIDMEQTHGRLESEP
jgi:hypothetical protein